MVYVVSGGLRRHPGRYDAAVERLTRADRACAVAAAAAHDLNNDLTVILSSVSSSLKTLEPGHPARLLLFELDGAARRCAWKTSQLLRFASKGVSRPVRGDLKSLLEG
jgi:hypothetical protein